MDVSVHPVKDYRFLLLIKGKDLGDQVTETDPQRIGASPAEARALSPDAEKTAQAANAFIAAAKKTLGGREKANMVLLRGFSTLPRLPDMGRTYKLKPAAIAAYPMYRGLAKLLGMKVIPTGSTFDDEIKTLREIYEEHDFFYIHYKPADAAGEDRDFEAKVKALESLDTYIPRLLDLNPNVFVVAGDHSTPAIMGSHSWHPVPILLHSDWTKGDGLEEFSERACALGSLGRIPATYVMLLVLAHAGKLAKFGP